MILAQLRALLERALYTDGLTPLRISRLGQSVSVEDLARAYLPRAVCVQGDACSFPAGLEGRLAQLRRGNHEASLPLDLTDPGTVNAVKVALALALGLDPGPMGCAVSWRYGAWGWVLRGADSSYMMSATIDETDPVRALVLAVEHVLGVK